MKKKVLLRERKRHTTRRLASTRYAVPAGGTPILGSDLGGCSGYPLLRQGKTPVWGTPFPGGGYPFPGGRYPLPRPGKGVPPTWTWEGCTPPLGPGKGVPPAWTWEGVFPCQWMGYPPPLPGGGVNGQTPVKTLPSPFCGCGR